MPDAALRSSLPRRVSSSLRALSSSSKLASEVKRRGRGDAADSDPRSGTSVLNPRVADTTGFGFPAPLHRDALSAGDRPGDGAGI
jgi:hypothetical protein